MDLTLIDSPLTQQLARCITYCETTTCILMAEEILEDLRVKSDQGVRSVPHCLVHPPTQRLWHVISLHLGQIEHMHVITLSRQ